jgi:hypothetical protein
MYSKDGLMMSTPTLNSNLSEHDLQEQFEMLTSFFEKQLRLFPRASLSKGQSQMKVSHATILSLMILTEWLSFHSLTRAHHFFKLNLFKNRTFIERSRYQRRTHLLGPVLQQIRSTFSKINLSKSVYTIIDSCPIALCHYCRAPRVKVFKNVANIGFCAAKNMHYYGFKCHLQISNDGHILNYVITKASIADNKPLFDLILPQRQGVVFADKGYMLKQTDVQLLKRLTGVTLYTQKRKNQKSQHSPAFDKWLKQKRGRIERVFSTLISQFNLTKTLTRSVLGFQTQLEQRLLAYQLKREFLL